MLADFVVSNREQIISRCRTKVAKRSSPLPSTAEIDHGVPMFLDELLAELRLGLSPNKDISVTAAKHGHDMLEGGFSPSQVVHGYGDVCQVVTEMAIEAQAPVSSDDFRMLNRCLDDAIAVGDHPIRNRTGRGHQAKSPIARATESGCWAMPWASPVSAAEVAFEAIQLREGRNRAGTRHGLARNLKAIADLNQRIQMEYGRLREALTLR